MAVIQALGEAAIIGGPPPPDGARKQRHRLACSTMFRQWPPPNSAMMERELRVYVAEGAGPTADTAGGPNRQSLLRRSPLSRQPHRDVGRHDVCGRSKIRSKKRWRLSPSGIRQTFYDLVPPCRSGDMPLHNAAERDECPQRRAAGPSQPGAEPLEPVSS
jgi:hypothetical protein